MNIWLLISEISKQCLSHTRYLEIQKYIRLFTITDIAYNDANNVNGECIYIVFSSISSFYPATYDYVLLTRQLRCNFTHKHYKLIFYRDENELFNVCLNLSSCLEY